MKRSAFRLFDDGKAKKKIKMVRFHSGADGFKKAEENLTRLVNQGWEIVSSGGGVEMGSGFVILQKSDDGENKGDTPP